MAARIRGSVTESMVRDAVAKARQRHPNLRVRIVEDDNGIPWLTLEGASDGGDSRQGVGVVVGGIGICPF
jgi:hypothetical protein